MPAAGACSSYSPHAASAFSSRKAAPGSTSRSIRSRAVSLPRDRWRSVALSPPPRATSAVRSRSSATSPSIRSRRRANSSDSRSTCEVRTATRSAYNRRVPSDELLRRYAELIIRVGVNLREGEDLNIVGALEHAPLARALAASAYRAGAHYVDVVYLDQHVKRALIEHGSDEALEWTPPWQLARLEYLHEHRGATISITGDPEPDLLADLDGERVGRARMKALAERGLEIVFEERTVNWTVAAFPNEGWARKVFGEPDVERLWELVARAVRLDEADPVEAWKQHVGSPADEGRATERAVVRRGALQGPRDRPHRRPDARRPLGSGAVRDLRRRHVRAEPADRGSVHDAGRATDAGHGPVDSAARHRRRRRGRGSRASFRGRPRRRRPRRKGGRRRRGSATDGRRSQPSRRGGARRRRVSSRAAGRHLLRHALRRERDLSHRLRRRSRVHARRRRRTGGRRGQHVERSHRLHDRGPGGGGRRPRLDRRCDPDHS